MGAHVEIARVAESGPEAGPRLLITAGVHGDEFEGIAAVRQLIQAFAAPDAAQSLVRGTLTLVPVVNEAACRQRNRVATDGLDLARVCPGNPAGSVTERTAHELSELIRSADYYVDLHSGGIAFSVLPLAGYSLHSERSVLERQREMARAFNLPIVWGTPGLDGRSLSVARDAGVPAIYAEYRGSGLCDPEGVRAYVDGCLGVMRLVDMIDGPPAPCRVERVVEDPRPDAGHMQICNPAPIDGFFEPAVELGQRIEAGGLFGTVADALGSAAHEVRATQSGIVLVLRTFARVSQGESVGVILETDAEVRTV